MHANLLHNGNIVPAGDKIVSPGQVGLVNGWGVFSTLRVYDGVLFEWDRHWARMKRDAARMHVPFPADSSRLEEDLLRLIDANNAHNSTLRVLVIRDKGGMWEGPNQTRDFDIVAFTADVNQWAPAMKLGVVPHGRHAQSEFSGTKYLSWSENLTRYERAHQQGFHEVVLLNERDEVAECTSANIFAIHGSHVTTPPVSSGCLPGITRAVLLEEIRIPGLVIEPAVLRLEDLQSADEVFITSTTREVLPVVEIQGLQLKAGTKVSAQLQAAFSAYTASYTAQHGRAAKV